METHATHNVGDIPAGDRSVIEQLLGQPLDRSQSVFIMAYTPRANIAARSAARVRLEQLFVAQAERARASGCSEKEADAAVEESMRDVRKRL